MSPATRRRRAALWAAVALLNLGFAGGLYLVYAFKRTVTMYAQVKSGRGWRGRVHRADPVLGFAPVPGARGAHLLPGGEIPMRYDRDGFRAPVGAPDDGPAARPVVLSLGCSFTYGDGVRAEEAYPHLVAQGLGGTARNAGVCSYGLAQMVILAERLVPSVRPDFLVVQYSGWLAERAASPFLPIYFGRLTGPYFTDAAPFTIRPPVFPTKVMDLDVDRFRGTPPGTREALAFFRDAGLPLLLHDDLHMLAYGIRRRAGLVPAPTSRRGELTAWAYGEIGRVARENGARMIVVVLGNGAPQEPFRPEDFPPDALVANAHGALLARVSPLTNERYYRSWAIWREGIPVPVDLHPNPAAHRVIADTVLAAIGAPGAAAAPGVAPAIDTPPPADGTWRRDNERRAP